MSSPVPPTQINDLNLANPAEVPAANLPIQTVDGATVRTPVSTLGLSPGVVGGAFRFILGQWYGIALDGAGTDQALAISSPVPFRVDVAWLYNASGAQTTKSAGGIYTAVAKGGLVVVPAAATWGVVSPSLVTCSQLAGGPTDGVASYIFAAGTRTFYFNLTSNGTGSSGLTGTVLLVANAMPGAVVVIP